MRSPLRVTNGAVMAWLRDCAAAAALLGGIASGVSAQALTREDVAPQGAVAARPADTQSFDILRSALKPRQNVRVRDVDGRVAKGKVVSTSENELVLSRPRRLFPFFRSDEHLSFRKDALEWVQAVDSTWNGQVIGLGVGVAVTALMVSASDETERSWLVLFPGSEIVIGAAYVGGLIDARHNETIYQRPAERRVTLAPIAAKHRLGVLASVSF